MSQKLNEGGEKDFCLTPRRNGRANSAVVLKECNVDDNQDFSVDSQGRLVNKKSKTCLSAKGSKLRVAECDTGSDPASKYVYKTMDNALAIFNAEGVGYLTPVYSDDQSDERGIRLRPRNYKNKVQKWVIVDSDMD